MRGLVFEIKTIAVIICYLHVSGVSSSHPSILHRIHRSVESSGSPSLSISQMGHDKFSVDCSEDMIAVICSSTNNCPSDKETQELCCHCQSTCCNSKGEQSSVVETAGKVRKGNLKQTKIGLRLEEILDRWLEKQGQSLGNIFTKASTQITEAALTLANTAKKAYMFANEAYRNISESIDGGESKEELDSDEIVDLECVGNYGKCATTTLTALPTTTIATADFPTAAATFEDVPPSTTAIIEDVPTKTTTSETADDVALPSTTFGTTTTTTTTSLPTTTNGTTTPPLLADNTTTISPTTTSILGNEILKADENNVTTSAPSLTTSSPRSSRQLFDASSSSGNSDAGEVLLMYEES